MLVWCGSVIKIIIRFSLYRQAAKKFDDPAKLISEISEAKDATIEQEESEDEDVSS